MSRIMAGLFCFCFGYVLVSDCANDDVGILPISEQVGDYRGDPLFPPGLYPGGNVRPVAHTAVGLAQAALITPRLSNGTPSASGKIGFVGLGMSNCKEAFTALRQQCLADTSLNNAKLKYVEAAKFGATLDFTANPADSFWTVNLPAALIASGCSAAQVQVALIFEAIRFPADWPSFPDRVAVESDLWVDTLHNARGVFPNLKIAYLTSLNFMGYCAQKTTLTEPFSLEQGFSVRDVITRQINGDSELDLSVAPWISWSAYLWSNGVVPRSDGFTWICPTDVAGDGIHYSLTGGNKIATLLRTALKSDSTAASWFLKP